MSDNPGSALAISERQTQFTDGQLAVLRQLGMSTASKEDVQILFHQAQRTGLDPFARQIYMIGRNQWDKRTQSYETKQTIQVGIDGFRLIARRAVDRAGESLGYADTLWCGPDGEWRDVWLGNEMPYAAKVTVLRDGHPFSAVAKFSSYAATGKGKNGETYYTGQWPKMPDVMIAKCAEALALRKAFPQDLSGLYTDDEMEQSGQVVNVVPVTVTDTQSQKDEVADANAAIEAQPLSPDWAVKIAAANTIKGVNEVYAEARRLGQASNELKALISERSSEIRKSNTKKE